MLLTDHIRQFATTTPKTKGYSPDTVEIHCQWLKNFATWAGPDATLAEYDETPLRQYRAHKLETKTYALRTLSSMYSAFRAFDSYLLAEGLRDRRAADCLGKVSLKNAPPARNLITEAEAFAMLDATRRYADPRRVTLARAILATLIHSGMRRGEFFGLRTQDVFLEERRIYIVRGKGGRPRSVYLCGEALDALRAYLAIRPASSEEALFMYNARLPIRIGALMNIFRETWAMADLPPGRKFTPHSFRHEFITRMVTAGADINSVAELVGHQNASTTLNVYVHPDANRLRAVADMSERKPITPAPEPAAAPSAPPAPRPSSPTQIDQAARNGHKSKRMHSIRAR